MADSEAGLFLIVDDETSITDAIGRLARQALPGPRSIVATASVPEEAMRILNENRQCETIVVLSDFNMGTPMNGLDLLDWVKQNVPGAHRFLMSGYAAAELEVELQRPIEATCLPKPFDVESLQAAFALLRPTARGEA
jgi:DNA-binding NtrC family response regulator